MCNDSVTTYWLVSDFVKTLQLSNEQLDNCKVLDKPFLFFIPENGKAYFCVHMCMWVVYFSLDLPNLRTEKKNTFYTKVTCRCIHAEIAQLGER